MQTEFASNWIALKTIVYREARRFLRIWPQTLLPPAITMVLYFVIFGNLIGSQIGDMRGFSYMQYITNKFHEIFFFPFGIIRINFPFSFNNIFQSYSSTRQLVKNHFSYV